MTLRGGMTEWRSPSLPVVLPYTALEEVRMGRKRRARGDALDFLEAAPSPEELDGFDLGKFVAWGE